MHKLKKYPLLVWVTEQISVVMEKCYDLQKKSNKIVINYGATEIDYGDIEATIEENYDEFNNACNRLIQEENHLSYQKINILNTLMLIKKLTVIGGNNIYLISNYTRCDYMNLVTEITDELRYRILKDERFTM